MHTRIGVATAYNSRGVAPHDHAQPTPSCKLLLSQFRAKTDGVLHIIGLHSSTLVEFFGRNGFHCSACSAQGGGKDAALQEMTDDGQQEVMRVMVGTVPA